MELSFRRQIICRWICLTLSTLGFFCYGSAFVIPHWMYIQSNGYILRYGIFTVCIATARSQACGTLGLETVNGMFVAAQVCATLALLSFFSSVISCGLTLCWPYPWSRHFLFVCSGSAFITTLFGGTMTALYISYHVELLSSLQFGFFMATGSLCLTPFIGGFALFAGKTTSRPKESVPDDDAFFNRLFVRKPSRWVSLPSTSTPSSSTSVNVTPTVRVSMAEPVKVSDRSSRMTVSTIHGSSESLSIEKPVTPSNIMPIFNRTPQNIRTGNVSVYRSTQF